MQTKLEGRLLYGAKGIQNHFSKIVGIPLISRWSWGGQSESKEVVVLILWEHDIRVLPDGREAIIVKHCRSKTASNGFKERQRHLNLIQSGARAYAVMAKQKPQRQGLHRFDGDHLIELARPILLTGNEETLVCPIVSITTVEHLRTHAGRDEESQIERDVLDIEVSQDRSATTKRLLIDARRGQGAFRSNVLKEWSGSCAVTGTSVGAAIRASHIRPWRDSNDEERLDPQNGLPLVATLDALFDRYLISFTDSGVMIISKIIEKECEALGLGGTLLRKMSPSQRLYLRDHRRKFRELNSTKKSLF